MRSEVEHSLICLFHLLAFLLCLHHPCLSFLSFLFLFVSSGSIHTHPCSTHHHVPNSHHSSSDYWSNSRHSMSHSILLQILLNSPCESGLSFFLFLGFFPFLDLKNLPSPLPFPFPLPCLYLCRFWSVYLGTFSDTM